MKAYKLSDLTHKTKEVLSEAFIAPVIINQCKSNGDIIDVFVLTHQPAMPEEDVKRLVNEIKGDL